MTCPVIILTHKSYFCSAVRNRFASLETDTGLVLHGEGQKPFQMRSEDPRILLHEVRRKAQVTAAGGPVLPYETYGGSNPSENTVCQPCSGDPVDTVTGEYDQEVTDVSIPGRGPNLDLERTYASTDADTLGRFGYGWTDSYSMSIAPDQYLGSSVMDVHQENGSVVQFSQQAGGSWAAAPRVLATLVHNGDGTWTFTRKATGKFKFSSSGQLTSESDLNGNTETLGYDSSGRLSTVTDAAGRTLTFSYSGSSTLVSEITDPGSRTVSYGYDTNANLTSVTDTGGGVTHYGYGANHLLTTVTDPDGHVTTNVYDSSRRVISQTDPANRTTTWSYSISPSTLSGTVTVTDPRSIVSQYTVTGGEVTQKIDAYGTAQAATWTYTYDPNTDGVTAVTDPDNHSTSYTYDTAGNELTQTDALNRTTTYTYNSLDEATTKTTPAGETVTSTYDTDGNLDSTSAPIPGGGNRVTTYTHGNPSHPGDVTSITDPDNHTNSYTYDSYGDQTSVTDAAGDQTTYTYNVLGQKLTQVEADGNVSGANPANYTTTWTYDGHGWPTKVVDPTGATTTTVYDLDGNKTSVKDPDTHTTAYSYDNDNELVGVTYPDTSTTSDTYYPDGQTDDRHQPRQQNHHLHLRHLPDDLATSTDPAQNKTTYGYDSDGRRRTTVKDPAGEHHHLRLRQVRRPRLREGPAASQGHHQLRVRRRRQPHHHHRRQQQDHQLRLRRPGTTSPPSPTRSPTSPATPTNRRRHTTTTTDPDGNSDHRSLRPGRRPHLGHPARHHHSGLRLQRGPAEDLVHQRGRSDTTSYIYDPDSAASPRSPTRRSPPPRPTTATATSSPSPSPDGLVTTSTYARGCAAVTAQLLRRRHPRRHRLPPGRPGTRRR